MLPGSSSSPPTPANIGPLSIFTPPPSAPDTFCRDFIEQWRACKTLATPFNYRIRRTRTPHWEILRDDEIDLDYHLRQSSLPATGGQRELGVMISRLHSHPLYSNRPLWKCNIIKGLEVSDLLLPTLRGHPGRAARSAGLVWHLLMALAERSLAVYQFDGLAIVNRSGFDAASFLRRMRLTSKHYLADGLQRLSDDLAGGAWGGEARITA